MTTVVTGRDAFVATAADAPAGARVPVRVTVTVADPFLAYRRARSSPGSVYLATTGGQSGWGYFGTDPVDFHEVDPADGATLATLAELLDGESLARGDCSIPYPCGAVGWLSYDVARELEALPETTVRDRALPRLQVGVYDRLAAWEEPRGDGDVRLHVTACPRLDEFEDAAAAYEFGRQHALELARRAREGDPAVEAPPVEADEARFESDTTREAFAERVRTVKEYIRDGDTFQANISQRLSAPAAVHPVEAFDALRAVNPAPYSALVEFPGVDLVSASPELLLERESERIVTEPIAGTRPRGATPDEDASLESDLLADEKERAEHAMLVDLERNDLGKVSRFGSVDVSEYRRVDRYSEVMHLVSEVEGELRADPLVNVPFDPPAGVAPDSDAARTCAALAAMFPGGTITGAPKPRTMAIIDEVERTRRGPYTGSIGVFGFDGRATCNIVIRTLVRYADEYHLRVGAGIVHDSEPEREYAETLDKGRALVTAVDEALGQRADLAVEGQR
ncbi:MAG: anthranilate synthase component I family protein [Haloarculaceae archaeon]